MILKLDIDPGVKNVEIIDQEGDICIKISGHSSIPLSGEYSYKTIFVNKARYNLLNHGSDDVYINVNLNDIYLDDIYKIIPPKK